MNLVNVSTDQGQNEVIGTLPTEHRWVQGPADTVDSLETKDSASSGCGARAQSFIHPAGYIETLSSVSSIQKASWLAGGCGNPEMYPPV